MDVKAIKYLFVYKNVALKRFNVITFFFRYFLTLISLFIWVFGYLCNLAFQEYFILNCIDKNIASLLKL